MLYFAFVLLLIGIIAGILGMPTIAIISIGVAKFIFFLFLVLFLIALVIGLGVFSAASK